MFDEVIERFCAICRVDSYEEAIAKLKEQFRDKSTSPAHWIHMIAREAYAIDSPDTVEPEYFFEILELIDTREKMAEAFATVPEAEADKFLTFVLKKLLPGARSNAAELAKKLPQRHTGGPKSKKPPEEECRAIYNEVENMARKMKRGVAQLRVAKRKRLSLRMVQRICKVQKERLRNSESDPIDI